MNAAQTSFHDFSFAAVLQDLHLWTLCFLEKAEARLCFVLFSSPAHCLFLFDQLLVLQNGGSGSWVHSARSLAMQSKQDNWFVFFYLPAKLFQGNANLSAYIARGGFLRRSFLSFPSLTCSVPMSPASAACVLLALIVLPCSGIVAGYGQWLLCHWPCQASVSPPSRHQAGVHPHAHWEN